MQKRKYKLLSYPLSKYTPLYGGGNSVSIRDDRQIKNGESCNTALVAFSNHSGTHIDAPRHFFDSGRSISDYDINELIFTAPFLLECPKEENELLGPEDLIKVKNCDLLLIHTGFSRCRGQKKYRSRNPGISGGAARYIRQKHPYIKAVGIDTISISSYQQQEEGRSAHQIFLQNDGFPNTPLCLIEDMDLSFNLKDLKRVYVVPLFAEGVDSMPCTVIGEF